MDAFLTYKNEPQMKGTKLYSILTSTCPRCQEEKMFASSIYSFRKFGKMHKSCSTCGLKYSKEPGFFTGATYVSYALTVALIITVFVASRILLKEIDTDRQIVLIIVSGVVLAPLNYRLSRNIWINFFNSYDPPKDK